MDTKRSAPSNIKKLHILVVFIAQSSALGFESSLPKIKEKRRLVRAFTPTKDKILSDVDNLLQLVHDFYNARLYPLQVSFLTATTLYFQSGDSIINPSMLTKYPLDRERYESYWNAFCLQKPEDIKREDIQACLFGARPVGDPNPNAHSDEVWDGYESDKNSDFELGRSKSMKLKKVEELSKLEYALRIQGGEHLDASRSHAVPRYDLSRHANGETYYTYAGIRIAGSEVDITEAFSHLRTNATDAAPPPPRPSRVDPPSEPTTPATGFKDQQR